MSWGSSRLADDVREALGDDTSDSAKRFARETLSATSLDVVRAYAKGMEALSRSQFNEALAGFSEAAPLDRSSGSPTRAMAIVSSNMGRQQDAETFVKEALGLIDGMTERERTDAGLFYFITSDYQPCVKEYGDLIAQYSADASARNNLRPLPVETARPSEGGRGDAAGREDPAEPRLCIA